jgi:NADH dehydrogenase FAD-containing subunit
VDAGGVVLIDGTRLAADTIVDASGLRPPPVIAETGLATGPEGGLRVDRHLRSVDDGRVFAVGDCAYFEERPLPGAGVYAVRQAPVLLHNLRAGVRGRSTRLDTFRPQSTYLLVLTLGDGTGLAVRGRLHATGRLAWGLKDRIDRRFLARYRTDPGPGGSHLDGSDEEEQP